MLDVEQTRLTLLDLRKMYSSFDDRLTSEEAKQLLEQANDICLALLAHVETARAAELVVADLMKYDEREDVHINVCTTGRAGQTIPGGRGWVLKLFHYVRGETH